MKTIGVYISHNKYGSGNPVAVSPTGNQITFNLDKVSNNLKKKIHGQMDIVQLTISEMEEILKAKTKMEKVSKSVLTRLFNK